MFSFRWFGRFTIPLFDSATTFNVPGRASAAIAEHSASSRQSIEGDAEAAGRLAAEHVDRARHARIAMMRESAREVRGAPDDRLGA